MQLKMKEQIQLPHPSLLFFIPRPEPGCVTACVYKARLYRFVVQELVLWLHRTCTSLRACRSLPWDTVQLGS